MNSNQHTTESTKMLKEQVMNDIQKVKDDINEIRHRVTPGQIIDDAIYYRRGGGDPVDTFNYLKENPVGTAFLTLGTLLLMEDKEHHSYEFAARGKLSEAREQVSVTRGRMQGAVQDMKNKVTAKFSRNKEPAVDTYEGFTGEAKSDVKSKFADAKAKISEKASQAKARFQGASANAKAKGHELYDASKNLDPMAYLALGAGLGAITGASIPVSGTETGFIDSNFEDKFSTFSRELSDALNQSVNILKNEFIGDVTDIKLDLF